MGYARRTFPNLFAKTKLEQLQLPLFTTRRDFEGKFHLFGKKTTDRYDAIIGRDLQHAIGLDILNSKQAFSWMGINVPITKMGH